MDDERKDKPERSGKHRRSSFVPPAEGHSDYIPSLPPVGSFPIPSAADVNYFPSVSTGKPEISQPAPPERLVVPTRQSLTSEQLATVFAEANDMSSAEQIALLDAQMTLREADVATAKGFFEKLHSANPEEAATLLDELKSTFGELDDSIARMQIGVPLESVDTTTTATSPTDAGATAERLMDTVVPQSAPVAVVTAGDGSTLDGGSITTTDERFDTVSGDDHVARERYRGWVVWMTIASAIATLVPLSFAIFTTFGAPLPELVDSFIGPSGVVIGLVTLVVAVPIILMARATSFRHGVSWRSALQRVMGGVGGGILAAISATSMAVGLFVLLLATSQGLGQQVASIPVVSSLLTRIAPNSHVTVIVVSIVITIGAICASLPRRLFRATMLVFTGFILAGPTIVLIQGIAIAANSDSALELGPESIVVATALLPLVALLFGTVESGIATTTSKDARSLHGLWLYIGLALGFGFAGFALFQGIVTDTPGTVFIGSNPVLNVTAPTTELAFVIGLVVFVVPVIFLLALALRHVTFATRRDDRDTPAGWARTVVVLVPLALIAADLFGVLGDPLTVLPGIPFLAMPILVTTGIMAGASVASKRTLTRGSRIVMLTAATLLTLVGWTLTLWSVPALAEIYQNVLAPVFAPLGLSGQTALAVPAAVLGVSVVVSLVISAIGSRSRSRSD